MSTSDFRGRRSGKLDSLVLTRTFSRLGVVGAPEGFHKMDWLTAQEVAARVSVARSTLYVLMRDHAFPRPLKIGGKRRWVGEEVESWLTQQAEARG